MDVILRSEVDHVYVANYGKIIISGLPDEIKQNQEVIAAYLGR
ncbi:MAG: ABC transporter ATP-binding protein C-terminal domain-containing protein [Candidatus Kariarchaeaceae archaeon]